MTAALLLAALAVFAVVDYGSHAGGSLRAVLFWWLALLGGMSLIAGGVVVRRRHANLGTSLLVMGSMMALIPTGRTLILPLLALGVIVLALREHTAQQRIS